MPHGTVGPTGLTARKFLRINTAAVGSLCCALMRLGQDERGQPRVRLAIRAIRALCDGDRELPETAMQPFPESAVLGWVLGLSVAVVVIGCMIVGFIARLWPIITHSWSEGDQQAQDQSTLKDGQGPQN